MSDPAIPPPHEDPTASLGANRDGHTRSFDPQPPPPIQAYQPPAPPVPPYQPPNPYQPPAAYPPPPAYQAPAAYPPPYFPAAPGCPAVGGHPPAYPPPRSSWAVTSLVVGIAGVFLFWCFFGIPCVLAIVFGHLGLSETRNNAKTGRGMAIAGLILGYVFLIPAILVIVAGFASDRT